MKEIKFSNGATWLEKLGGRKFVLSVGLLLAVVLLKVFAHLSEDSFVYSLLIVAGMFGGGNAAEWFSKSRSVKAVFGADQSTPVPPPLPPAQ